jgi:hypothetical protein
VATRPAVPSAVFHHVLAPGTGEAAILLEGAQLLLLLRCEHTPRRKQGFHMLLHHLTAQLGNLLNFFHNRIVIRAIGPQQFVELDAAQFEICASLHRGFPGIYGNLMQALGLLVGQIQISSQAAIMGQTQEPLPTPESVPSVPPTHSVTSKASRRALTGEFMRPLPAGRSLLSFPTPRDHGRSQQHQKTYRAECKFPTHICASSLSTS